MMRTTARSIGIAIALLLPMAASAQQATFLLDPPATLPTGPATIKRGGTLVEFDLRMPRAARLEGDVDSASASAGSVNSKYPLTRGAILIGSDDHPGIYCTSISNSGLGLAGPCLIDQDRDGRFDAISKAGFTSRSPERMLISSSNRVIGVNIGAPKPLPAPIAYTPVDYAAGHTAIARLTWISDFKPGKPGPFHLNFWWDASARGTGTGVWSSDFAMTFDGTPRTITVAGVTLRIDGFDPVTRGLKYEILSAKPKVPVRFGFSDRLPETIYISY